MSSTLTVGIALDLLTSAFALFVAGRVQQAIDIGVPVRASLPFWYGLAIFMLLDGGYATLVLLYEPAGVIPLLVLLVRRFAFLIGMASLVVMLLTWINWHNLRVYAVGYYVVIITFVEAQTLYQNPKGHEILDWSVQFVYTRNTGATFNFIEGVAIFAPLGILALVYLGRYRLQPTSGQRFRLAVLGLSILSFCAGIVMGFWDNAWFWYGLFENRLGFTVAAGMLMALRPPIIIRKGWGIPVVTHPSQWTV